jgi:hypothetical protein
MGPWQNTWKRDFLKWDAEIFRLQLHSFYVDPDTAQNLNVDPDPGD